MNQSSHDSMRGLEKGKGGGDGAEARGCGVGGAYRHKCAARCRKSRDRPWLLCEWLGIERGLKECRGAMKLFDAEGGRGWR